MERLGISPRSRDANCPHVSAQAGYAPKLVPVVSSDRSAQATMTLPAIPTSGRVGLLPLTPPLTNVRISTTGDPETLRMGGPMARFSALVASLLLSFPHPAPCGELPRAEPGEVGLAVGRLADLKPSLQRLVDEGKIPGGVALVARHGKVADVTTFGYRDLAAKTPMTEDTIFAVASMTKPITCVAVMTLVEQGKLGLDDPVAKYIPELKD